MRDDYFKIRFWPVLMVFLFFALVLYAYYKSSGDDMLCDQPTAQEMRERAQQERDETAALCLFSKGEVPSREKLLLNAKDAVDAEGARVVKELEDAIDRGGK